MKKKIGPLTYRMPYGKYLETYKNGNKNSYAKPEDDGYAIVSKSDPSNINWVSKATFDLIYAGHSLMMQNPEKI